MQHIKTAVAVFCTACICAELIAQITESGWARRSIKAVAGLYILAVAFQALPQIRAEWKAFSIPAASSTTLGSLDNAVLAQAQTELERTLEAHCLEEAGAAVTLTIALAETPTGTAVQSVIVTPFGECAAQTRQAVDALLKQALAIQPEWTTPGGETLR